MAPGTVRLTEVEQLVLLAALRLGDEAYAVPIRDVVASNAGISLSRGSIYVALERLEARGLVESWFSEPTAERGGKARRLFRVCPEGVSALRASRRAIDRLAVGTPLERPR
jgi:DNA-binding PadR family transcriptional regulator